MKNIFGKILLLPLLICCSCSSIYRFSIDVQEPALVTLPVSAQNVLILNNTVTQPLDHGIERSINGKSITDDYPISLDSTVWSAMDEIAVILDESNFFDIIATYQESVREDNEWLSMIHLSPELQSDLYDTENFDALFVIERLFLFLKEDVKPIINGAPLSEQSAFIDLRADGVIICSMYVYGNEKPLVTFQATDSLILKTMMHNDSISILKIVPEYSLNKLAIELGNKVAKYFIPTWKTEKRSLFVNFNSRMQEAVGYAADSRWTNAESIWITEFEKKTKPVDKAKIAYNLAVANEMQDRFESAIEWAQKAKEYFKNVYTKNNSQEIELIDNYVSKIEKRIESNNQLDLQWGKE